MSERDWRQTPTLDEFNAMYDEDDNIWWRIACGHHQNLYEAAVERYQTAEAQVQRVRHVVLTGSIAAPVLTEHDQGYNKALSDVFSAMNGWGREECPTCSWPVRETVGLVCQTCGTDYGRALDGGTDD